MYTRKKDGFTLVEMLVVIAIIAILLAITIPTVTSQLNKAAAAANAANLRAIYGQLNIMKLQEPRDFETLLSGNHHNGISIGDSSFVGKLLEELAVDRFATFTAVNGRITLPTGLVIDALPSAKVVSYDGGFLTNSVQVEEGTEMTIVITDEHVITCYHNYTIDNFADIAEDGKLDGPVYGGALGEICDQICRRCGHRFTDFFGRPSDYCLICKYKRS